MKDAGGEGLLLDGGADPPLPGQLLGRFRHRQGVLPFQGRTEATADFVVGEKGPSGHDQSLNATTGIGRVIRHAFKRISHLPFLSPKASLSIFIWSNQSNQKHRSWHACARRCRTSTVPSPILTFAASHRTAAPATTSSQTKARRVAARTCSCLRPGHPFHAPARGPAD